MEIIVSNTIEIMSRGVWINKQAGFMLNWAPHHQNGLVLVCLELIYLLIFLCTVDADLFPRVISQYSPLGAIWLRLHIGLIINCHCMVTGSPI